jgi:hypothetical protein
LRIKAFCDKVGTLKARISYRRGLYETHLSDRQNRVLSISLSFLLTLSVHTTAALAGALDPTLGTGGKVLVDFPGSSFSATDDAIRISRTINNRSAADPAAVRGATRSPMSAQRE